MDFKLLKKTLLLKSFVDKEFNSKIPVDFISKFKLLSKGFLSETKSYYKFETDSINDYLSDFKRLKTSLINEKYSLVLDNKLLFEKAMQNYVKIPKSLAYIDKGNFISLCDDANIIDINTLIDCLYLKNSLIIKPVIGGGGKGLIILSINDNKILLNNSVVDKDKLERTLMQLDNNFVSEFITQSNYSNDLYPYTTNTIRVVTMLSPEDNKAFIPIAVQRIGTNQSVPTDAWVKGGINAEINIDTGTLGKAASYPINGQLEWYERHPETGAKINGKEIPNWFLIKKDVLNAAEKMPFLKYIGWDIALTDDGYAVLEGNNYSDVNFLQVHRPLLKDYRTYKFYKYYNII